MRTSTPRAPRRNAHLPVKTIDIFRQPKPIAYANMGYSMSNPAPLNDPCAYASSVSGPNPPVRPANRIPECLGPTFEETESQNTLGGGGTAERSVQGDPTMQLAKAHDIDAFKESMTVAGVPVGQYRPRQPSRSVATKASTVGSSAANAANSAAKDNAMSLFGDTTSDNSLSETTMLVTPMRRPFEGPQGSTAKRPRTVRHSEGDLSSDTVRSVLRLVDESLVDTPEREPMVTPRVLRAVPGPSPREQGPTYAYGAESRLEKYGGLLPKPASVLAPFSMTRI